MPERFEELVAAVPDEVEVNALVACFEVTYVRGPRIGGRHRDPKVSVHAWSHYADAVMLDPKTTNACEGFHNALQSVFM